MWGLTTVTKHGKGGCYPSKAAIRAIRYFQGKNITIERLLQMHHLLWEKCFVSCTCEVFTYIYSTYTCICRYMHVHFLIYLDVKHPSIHHSMDIWHKAKKLRKALNEVSLFVFVLTQYIPEVCIKALCISCRQEKLRIWKSWHNGVVTLWTTSGTVVEHVTMIWKSSRWAISMHIQKMYIWADTSRTNGLESFITFWMNING